MERLANLPRPLEPSADIVFDFWFRQTLRTLYEPVMHERLPDEIVAVLKQIDPVH